MQNQRAEARNGTKSCIRFPLRTAETTRSMKIGLLAVRFRQENVLAISDGLPGKGFPRRTRARGANTAEAQNATQRTNLRSTSSARAWHKSKSRETGVHAALREDICHSSGIPTDTLTDWRYEQRFVSLGQAVLSTPRDIRIDDVARGILEAWQLATRPNVTWPCWLRTIARCSEQRVCKRHSANQCVAALALQLEATPARKRSMADTVRNRVLSDG